MQNRYSLRQPLRPPWCGGLLRSWGDGGKRQQMRPDACGSRHRAHCTESGGGASSRQAAELRRIVSLTATTSGPTEAPSYRMEMRERSGSHGRRRYALRQGQKRRPAGLTAPQWEQSTPAQPPMTTSGTTAGDPVTTSERLVRTLSTMRPCAQPPTTEPWRYDAEAPVYGMFTKYHLTYGVTPCIIVVEVIICPLIRNESTCLFPKRYTKD